MICHLNNFLHEPSQLGEFMYCLRKIFVFITFLLLNIGAVKVAIIKKVASPSTKFLTTAGLAHYVGHSLFCGDVRICIYEIQSP